MSAAKTAVELCEFTPAPATEESTTISILDAVKANPKVIAYCTLVTVGPMIFGFDTIVVGVCVAMPAFQ
jgi:hypothetical protein